MKHAVAHVATLSRSLILTSMWTHGVHQASIKEAVERFRAAGQAGFAQKNTFLIENAKPIQAQ